MKGLQAPLLFCLILLTGGLFFHPCTCLSVDNLGVCFFPWFTVFHDHWRKITITIILSFTLINRNQPSSKYSLSGLVIISEMMRDKTVRNLRRIACFWSHQSLCQTNNITQCHFLAMIY